MTKKKDGPHLPYQVQPTVGGQVNFKKPELPSIIAAEYKATSKEVVTFLKLDDVYIVRVGDKQFPHWSAIDAWKINSFSKDWAQRGRITVAYANSYET